MRKHKRKLHDRLAGSIAHEKEIDAMAAHFIARIEAMYGSDYEVLAAPCYEEVADIAEQLSKQVNNV